MRSRALLVLALAVAAGCSSTPPSAPVEKPTKAERAPDQFRVRMETSKGPLVMEVNRVWAPRGADRFYELVVEKFFDEARFFRVVPRWVVQFGIQKDPEVNRLWRELKIPDDPVKAPNKRGYVAYAMDGPNTRTTQIYINLQDNQSKLDGRGFAPFARVVEGMDVVDQLYKGYGEMAPRGAGPDPDKIEVQGNAYLERFFPRLDYIKTARIEK